MDEDLFQTLHRDHEEVRDSFRKLKGEERIDERTRLLYDLESQILPHFLAEERVLYPRLREEKAEGVREDALRSVAEHHALRLVLRDLAETPANDEMFPAKMHVLEEMVENHVREEETDIFRDVRERLGEEETRELLRRFRNEKESVPCGPAGKGWLAGN